VSFYLDRPTAGETGREVRNAGVLSACKKKRHDYYVQCIEKKLGVALA
jgi:hypothetical protein